MDKYCSKYLLKHKSSNLSNLDSLNESFPIILNNFDIANSFASLKYTDSNFNKKNLPGDSPQQTNLPPFFQNNNSKIELILLILNLSIKKILF